MLHLRGTNVYTARTGYRGNVWPFHTVLVLDQPTRYFNWSFQQLRFVEVSREPGPYWSLGSACE